MHKPLILIFTLIISSCISKEKKSFHQFNTVPGMIGCEDGYKKLKITYESEIIIHGSYFKDAPKESQVIKFLNEQTKFLFGTFHDGIPMKSFNFFVSNERPEFKIHRIYNTQYGSDLTVDKLESPRASDYLNYFYSNKISPKRNDQAFAVNFTTDISVHFCGSIVPTELSLTLPKDPYLAYWSVNPTERRLMKNAHFTNITNPCAHDEFVEIKSPTFLWYSWSPRRKSYDANKKIFDCTQLVQNKVVTSAMITQIPLMQKKMNFHWKNKNKIFLSAIFGRINNSPDGIRKANEVFQKLVDKKVSDWNLLKADITGAGDLGLISFVSFFEEIEKKYKVNFKFDQKRKIYQAVIEKDKKIIELNLYFGGTDLEWEKDPYYLSNLLYFFEHSDLFFYFGHSGMGQNFDFKRISEGLNIPEHEIVKKIRTKKEVFYSFMGCYSTAYIGEEILKARSGLGTNLALSGVRHFVTDFPQLFLENIFSQEEVFHYPSYWQNLIFLYLQ
jgi:hypothetical protein